MRRLPTLHEVRTACALYGGADAPDAPAVPRRAPQTRQQPERDQVLTPVLQWLAVLSRQVPGLTYTRIYTTGRRLADGTWIPNPMKGLEDIQVLVPPHGRLWALECKSADGRQRPGQKERQAAVEAAGGLYSLPRSLADAQAIWQREFGR